MKKLLILLMFMTSLFAITQNEMVNMVKSNPALLDTPQGKMMLQQYGMTKEQVLALVNSKKSTVVTKDQQTIFNDINISKDNNQTQEDRIFKEQLKEKLLKEYDTILDRELDDKIKMEKEKKAKEQAQEKPLVHPFTYKTSEELIDELKTKQQQQEKKELKRFSDGFFDNKNQTDLTSLPVPEWYAVTANDTLQVTLFGAKNESFELKVKSNGKVLIPSYGPLTVAGKSFKEVEKLVKTAFEKTYPNNKAVVEIEQYSSMQVTVTGEVTAPGIYNLSSLSTLKDALISANGVKASGSVREIEIKRNGKVIKKADLYDLILFGDTTGAVFLQANDVVYVPVAKNLVSVMGEVKREGIYELTEDETLDDLLAYCGGATAKANTQFISIKRYEKNGKVASLNVTAQESKKVVMADMDEVFVYPVYAQNVKGVYVYGNVINPGFWELSKTVKSVGELFQTHGANVGGLENIFLPDTHFEYAVIKRFDKKLSFKMVQVNLKNELEGKTRTELTDKDEIYIFDRRIMSGSPYVEISGDPVAKPGKYMYFDGMSVEDLILAAGVNSGSIIDKSKIKVRAEAVDMNKTPFFQLQAFDDILVYDENLTKPKNYAHVYGEVNNQGQYEVGENTTLEDLINMAGGLTEKAAKNKLEITHYTIQKNIRDKELISYDGNIEDMYALNIQKDDEIRIFKIPKWEERQTVKILGEVNYPGEYVVYTGERLFDVIERAGGFSEDAFIEGAVFSRESLKEAQQKELKSSLFRLKQNITAKSLSATDFGGSSSQTAQIVDLIKDLELQADEYAPQGRIALELNKQTYENKKSSNNIILEDQDTLYIPSKQSIVTVIGEVLSQSTIIFQKGKDVEDYIALAGGLKETANEESIFVIHANGMTEKAYKGWFSGATKIQEGDTIFIPPTIDTFSNLAAAKDITSVIYQLAISAASLKTIGAL